MGASKPSGRPASRAMTCGTWCRDAPGAVTITESRTLSGWRMRGSGAGCAPPPDGITVPCGSRSGTGPPLACPVNENGGTCWRWRNGSAMQMRRPPRIQADAGNAPDLRNAPHFRRATILRPACNVLLTYATDRRTPPSNRGPLQRKRRRPYVRPSTRNPIATNERQGAAMIGISPRSFMTS